MFDVLNESSVSLRATIGVGGGRAEWLSVASQALCSPPESVRAGWRDSSLSDGISYTS